MRLGAGGQDDGIEMGRGVIELTCPLRVGALDGLRDVPTLANLPRLERQIAQQPDEPAFRSVAVPPAAAPEDRSAAVPPAGAPCRWLHLTGPGVGCRWGQRRGR